MAVSKDFKVRTDLTPWAYLHRRYPSLRLNVYSAYVNFHPTHTDDRPRSGDAGQRHTRPES